MKISLSVKARDAKAGMDDGEIIAALMLAKRSNCRIYKTRVGFRGQIIEMQFTEKEKEDG